MTVVLLFSFVSAGVFPAASDKEARKAYDQAFNLYSSGNYPKALEMYEKASQLAPDDAEIWMEYTSCLRKVGRYQSAARAGWCAVEADPRNATAWHNLGNVFLSAHSWEAAEFCFQQEAKRQKDKMASARNFLNLGYQQRMNGFNEAARKSYEQAFELTPDNPLAMVDKGALIACNSPTPSAEAEQLIRKGLSLFEKSKNNQGTQYAKETLSSLADKEKLCNSWQPAPSFTLLPGEFLKQPEAGKARNLKIDAKIEKRFLLQGGRILRLTTPENWIERLQEKGPQGSSYSVDFDEPQGNYRMRLSIVPTLTETPDLKAMIESARKYLLANSAEKEIPIVPLTGKSAKGYYVFATDKDLVDKPPQPDNFKYILSCIVGKSRYCGSISVFSNRKDQDFLAELLDVLNSWDIE
jgi:tetratricopeptide (TPR) repeat protein